jgi:hypothetical protein
MAQKIYVHTNPEIFRVYLPSEKDFAEEDKTWFEHRAMTEADYQKFVDLTSTVKLANQRKKGKEKEDDKAEVDMMLGTTRAFLIENLIVNWNVIGEDGKVLAVTPNNIRKLPPEIVKVWVDDIYEQNPILKNEEEDEGDKEITKAGGKLPKA